MTGSITRHALALAAFAVLTVGLIAVTEWLTRERIIAQMERARDAAVHEILAPAGPSDALELDTVFVDAAALGLEAPSAARVARSDGRAAALVVPLRVPDGYSGDIHLLLGILADGRVAGARVVDHRETPGLGDGIDVRRSDWIEDFRGRSLGDPPIERWTVRREGGEFDAFTGATITPRAVTRAIARALQWFEEEGAALLAAPPAGDDP